MTKTRNQIKQTAAVQAAYDTLLNIYHFSAIPDVTKNLVIIMGKQYIVKDYEDNVMSGTFTPFKRLRRTKGATKTAYLTIGPAGGHITVFDSEFVKLA